MAAVTGVVRDVNGLPVQRTVRIYTRSTGALQGTTTSNATTGVYSFVTATTDEVNVVCLSDATTTTENDLILRAIPA